MVALFRFIFHRIKQFESTKNVQYSKIFSSYYSSRNNYSDTSKTSDNPCNRSKRWILLGCFGALGISSGLILLKDKTNMVHSDSNIDTSNCKRDDLPTYRMREGVYDITDFVENHPGGDKILLAAGNSVEPYWQIYQQHRTPEILQMLEEFRIGNLSSEDVLIEEVKDQNDIYYNDPKRHPALIVNSEKPFNAETPVELIMDSFFTPNDLFYVRNHMPVPNIDARKHLLTIEGVSVKHPLVLSVDDLKRKFTRVAVNSALQCAGNRRSEMGKVKKVQGLNWKSTAIGNAKWAGVRLRDVVIAAGVSPTDTRIKHVILRGADADNEGNHYEASILFEKAMKDEVIIAYEMNGEDIPRDHGYPIRLIAPGLVGARQVKFLSAIILSEEESKSHWQAKDYRGLPPFIDAQSHQNDFQLPPSIQELPVQSAFCYPNSPMTIPRYSWYLLPLVSGQFDVMGYAWSGGGRGIIRVEVSVDGGETWQAAELIQDPDQDIDHMWSWTLFKSTVKIPDNVKRLDLICKATDRSYNTQPDTVRGIWNIRGFINNAWHHIPIEITDE
ncbi:unnamed protein product [Thelazia callipaeda]|uniref:sulfite oxidase n=1 Tax=Thelazia callipaeda TaxID=103827 RepID=A0A0N5D3P4_THECL|nr:unnamed protein product [Thelazia callipaeda]